LQAPRDPIELGFGESAADVTGLLQGVYKGGISSIRKSLGA